MEPVLQLRAFRVFRGSAPVVPATTVDVNAGETLCVLGPNGVGKTTLLLGLLRQLHTDGSAIVAGDAVETLTARQLARRFALVPQGYDGFLGFRVRDFVELARYAVEGDGSAIVDDALAAAELSDLAERPLGSLSGGQRQRVLLAAALAQGTPMLLLDEPTANLDPRHAVAFMRTLLDRQQSCGVASVLVTHDINLALWLDGPVLLLDGENATVTDAAALRQSPTVLDELFDAPLTMIQADDATTVTPWASLLEDAAR